jgi:RNA polymerase sigma-70 factor (ECF subfamily)
MSNPAVNEAIKSCLPEMQVRALSMTRGDHADADDLVQQTMLHGLQEWANSPEKFAEILNVRAWLQNAMRNIWINVCRKAERRRRKIGEMPLDTLEGLFGDVDVSVEEDSATGKSNGVRQGPLEERISIVRAVRRDSIDPNDISDETRSAIAALDPRYREVLERADLRGEAYDDIAREMGIPTGTVMSRLYRARCLLEDQLADLAERDYGIKRKTRRTADAPKAHAPVVRKRARRDTIAPPLALAVA